jgi:hypothetical protein
MESGRPLLIPPVLPSLNFTPSPAGFGALVAPTAGTPTYAAEIPALGQEEPMRLKLPSLWRCEIWTTYEK